MSPAELTGQDGMALLARARRALLRHHGRRDEEGIPPGEVERPVLGLRRGAFVSLHGSAGLRGCIGSLEPTLALGELMDELAVAAATRDPRFPPLPAAELEIVRLEISVLAPPQSIATPEEIRVGEHGLVLGRGPRRGVLLPQVAVEQGWDAGTFLTHTCLKAALDGEAWRAWASGRDDALTVQVFTVQRFREPGP